MDATFQIAVELLADEREGLTQHQNYVRTMYPRYLIGMSDKDMIAEMRRRLQIALGEIEREKPPASAPKPPPPPTLRERIVAEGITKPWRIDRIRRRVNNGMEFADAVAMEKPKGEQQKPGPAPQPNSLNRRAKEAGLEPCNVRQAIKYFQKTRGVTMTVEEAIAHCLNPPPARRPPPDPNSFASRCRAAKFNVDAVYKYAKRTGVSKDEALAAMVKKKEQPA